nr:PREDICTED: PGC-1 and ERR-induced regulator in muscle protein 1-like [Balearica regulorum gibbericeps]
MDNFEYSIQLNDRDWAEFFLASEECNLAPAALATAEEQCLSDIEQGDSVPGRDCHASTNGQIAARVGSRPGPGTGSSAPRGVPRDASLCWPAGGHLALPELLSGSEDEADLGSVSRFLCESDKPGCPSSAPMPSAQGRQPPCPPAATLAGPAGGPTAAQGRTQHVKQQHRSRHRHRRKEQPAASKGKEKAAKPAPVKVGSEEAGESKRLVPSPGTDEGDPAMSAPLKQKVKELGAQPLGKAKATKHSKPGQAGGSGVRDNVPVIPASGAAAPPGEACQEVLGKPLHPKSVAASGGDAAEGAHGEPAAETPGDLGPPCFAAGASARADTLDVTWPEMYDYLFCDSQGEEEGMENSVELQNEDPDSAPVKDSLVISVPEVYEHFFPDRPGNRAGWRGIFSITPASEVKKAVGALKSLLQRPMRLVRGQAPVPQALVRRGSEEKLPLVPLAPLGRGQAQPEGLDMALVLTGRPEAPLALTHKDMCLVFCAFASWAVKTSDLQAPDAWKTVFLASFGTLSAIRYFRRQVREGHPRS